MDPGAHDCIRRFICPPGSLTADALLNMLQVHHTGNASRLVLIVDIWNPGLNRTHQQQVASCSYWYPSLIQSLGDHQFVSTFRAATPLLCGAQVVKRKSFGGQIESVEKVVETKTTCTEGITQVCISHYVQHIAHHQRWFQVAKLVTPLTPGFQKNQKVPKL